MASSKERQRKLARAKLDRQMARRAARRRRTRQVQAGIGAGLAVLLIVLGSVWLLGGFDRDEKPAAAEEVCTWTPRTGADLKDVGTPPAADVPTQGSRPMILTTSAGRIEVALDLTNAPCAGASFAHLAGRSFYDNTKCHELTAEGALRCGDPSGTGQGGPTYAVFSENVPEAPTASPAPQAPAHYPRGTVALIGSPPGTNGSQFLIFHRDASPAQPAYPIVGRVSAGLEILDKIVKAGTVDNGSGQKVKPKTDVVIQSLTVGEADPAAPVEPPSPAPSGATPGGTASPRPTPTASAAGS
ncbi:MAG TPA: peptidylprolyl isomerase [Pilimelia sp.]|nr:peptidylprolyl isomerase [Pilimelia sp.]